MERFNHVITKIPVLLTFCGNLGVFFDKLADEIFLSEESLDQFSAEFVLAGLDEVMDDDLGNYVTRLIANNVEVSLSGETGEVGCDLLVIETITNDVKSR